MMTTVPYHVVVRSWTINAAETDIATLAKAAAAQSSDIGGVNIVLCPPFAALPSVRAAVGDTGIAVGAPAIRDKHGGKITDEVAASILTNRFEYAIVGHWLWDETIATVASETAAALRHGIRPILCVWDTNEHHRRREAIEVTMRRQIQGALSRVDFDLAPRSLAIAYEPAWAIESNQVLSAEQASEILEVIRTLVAQQLGEETATSVPLLYAGRVNPSDVSAFAASEGINGILVIDDDINPADFMQIAQAFSTASPHGGQRSPASFELLAEGVAAGDIELTAEQQAVSLLLKRSLLPIISELENALQFLEDREAEGLNLIREKLDDFTQWERIDRLGEIGERFDPDLHRAIGTDERLDYPSRAVVEVLQPGYRVDDLVVQKAEVIVNR